MKKISIILLLLLAMPVSTIAAEESVNDLAAQGSEAFAREDFDKAFDLYGKALELEPGKAALLYNQANVLYRQEKYTEAMTLYEKAIKSGPSRKLLSNIYFNSGNTALQLAKIQTAEKQEITELKKALSYYEKSFEMYRNSLEHARAVSIAEGRNVQEAGLYARQNWALARESWTGAWDKIRELERKNLKLEDGVTSLLQAQLALLPNLERIYLNSFSEDILNFNLKRLAEYQLDYHADITSLNELAAKEEEKLQAELDNLNTSQPAAGDSDSGQESAVISEQLKIAGEIKKAIQQAASLDEWIVDGLKRGTPLQAWQNNRRMIDLLQGLTSYLKKEDPAIQLYQSLILELGETESLLNQAANLVKMKESEGAKAAGQKRVALAQAKSGAAIATINKINLLLQQIKSAQQEESNSDPSNEKDPIEEPALTSKTENASTDLLNIAAKKLIIISINELTNINNKIVQELKEGSLSISEEGRASVKDQLSKAGTAMLWYTNLSLPITKIIATIIQDTETREDQLQAALDITDKEEKKELQLGDLPNEEQINILLFKLAETENLIVDQLKGLSVKSEGQQLVNKIQKGLKGLNTSWSFYKTSRKRYKTRREQTILLKASIDLRTALIRNLLIFSPETAIALYYDRTKVLQDNLVELLPARGDNRAVLEKQYKKISQEAAALNSLLVQYFSELADSIADLDNQEKQAAFSNSIPLRRKSVKFIQRLIDAGKDGTKLLKENKYQQAELLLKDMSNSLDKSRMAFLEKPKESQEVLTLTIEYQKNLEEQSRAANEASAIEGSPGRIIPYIVNNQSDISELTDIGIGAIKQQIGMSEIPTHGQEDQPQSGPNQQVDTAKLKEAIDKMAKAQVEMGKIITFIKAAEFHNTPAKHQEVIKFLQEAIDLLKNKQEEKGEEGQEGDQEGDKEKKEDQQKEQGQDGEGQGQNKPKQPLELSPQEARDLLQELNKQDENQQTRKKGVQGKRSFDTPRPW